MYGRHYLDTFAKRKLSYFRPLSGDHSCQITKTVVKGYVVGRRRRGRPLKQFVDRIKQWTKMATSQCVWAAEDRSRWKELVSQAMVANDQTRSAKTKKKTVTYEATPKALVHDFLESLVDNPTFVLLFRRLVRLHHCSQRNGSRRTFLIPLTRLRIDRSRTCAPSDF